MEDSSSLRSSDSAGTSEEYEIIEGETTPCTAPSATLTTTPHSTANEPTLIIANNGNMDDLQDQLSEVNYPYFII